MTAQVATLDRQVPPHHREAVSRILAAAPPGIPIHALVNSATIAAWALRPDDLRSLTLGQYTDLVMAAAFPVGLRIALRHRGDRRHIRTVADEITRHIALHFN
ncbi:hypothetical protein E6W39_29325 [Kitasatospora acidiphila]|uniref:Uncharacterized protein n=1 Tax=Kitasatospora acidiphila TaxID=2567942 RepID=A0A540W981_9ACTN|nr:hypothetical protein [Kitasatospora acidiphila]TQF05586.1 hypothetical protein E6W39_29325 [Kitasatospora acidiphila]